MYIDGCADHGRAIGFAPRLRWRIPIACLIMGQYNDPARCRNPISFVHCWGVFSVLCHRRHHRRHRRRRRHRRHRRHHQSKNHRIHMCAPKIPHRIPLSLPTNIVETNQVVRLSISLSGRSIHADSHTSPSGDRGHRPPSLLPSARPWLAVAPHMSSCFTCPARTLPTDLRRSFMRLVPFL